MTVTDASLEAIANLRDLGGHHLRDGGRVRGGVAYRSAELSSDAGAEALAELGVRVVFDLRTDAEREQRPDRLPRGVRHVVADVLSSAGPEASPATLMTLIRDPAAADALLGRGGSARLFREKYREFVTLPSAQQAYHRLFTQLANGQDGPLLFHCTTGKDRTGWAAAALLLFLGVEEDEVRADYLASNDAVRGMVSPMLAAFAAAGGDPDLMEPFAYVREEYLDAAMSDVRSTFGSFDAYFDRGLSMDDGARSALRARLVDRA